MMPKTVFITGIDGFTGRYLAENLHRAGYQVSGMARRAPASPVIGAFDVFTGDLCSTDALRHIFDSVQADYIVHLAAIAFVGHLDISSIYQTNVVGTRNLLEALCCNKKTPQSVLLASSANVYGNSVSGMLDEQTQLSPANDYAVSKVAMEYVAKLYHSRLPLTIVRPFNYTGVGQSESFLVPKIINHILRRAPIIELGNLDVARDFSDVRSVVQIYRKLLETPAACGNTYNVCSGQAWTLNELLAIVRDISGQAFDVVVNPAFVRHNEVKILLGSSKLLLETIGHIPTIPLRDTLQWMLESGEKHHTINS